MTKLKRGAATCWYLRLKLWRHLARCLSSGASAGRSADRKFWRSSVTHFSIAAGSMPDGGWRGDFGRKDVLVKRSW